MLGAEIAEASENTPPAQTLIVYADGYGKLGLYALIGGAVLIAISPFVRKLMGGLK
jgi:POT family proton-dependent oligopeptide transporter